MSPSNLPTTTRKMLSDKGSNYFECSHQLYKYNAGRQLPINDNCNYTLSQNIAILDSHLCSTLMI